MFVAFVGIVMFVVSLIALYVAPSRPTAFVGALIGLVLIGVAPIGAKRRERPPD